jgi:GT2 family glycosyltransferase
MQEMLSAMQGALGGFAQMRGQARGAILPLEPEGLQAVQGWVLPGPEAQAGAPEIAIEIDGGGITMVRAGLGTPNGAPPGACGFAWPLPAALADGQAHRLRAYDLQAAQELEGSPLDIQLTPMAGETAPALVETKPSPGAPRGALGQWMLPLAGEITAALPVQLAEGLWLSARQPALHLRYQLMLEDGRRGVRVVADAASGRLSLHMLPHGAMPPPGVATPIRARAWLPQASENIAQLHGEIWLTQREGSQFTPLRRLRRGRIFRRPSWLTAEVTLSAEEAALGADLWLTIAALDARGLCALPPEFAEPPAPEGARMEDARLEGSFAALATMVLAHRGATADPPGLPPAAPLPTVPATARDAAHPPTQVIVPVYNGDLVVRDCLRALRESMTGPAEIVILDDGSRAHTAELLRAEAAADARFVLHRRDVNRGYTKTINEGVMLTEAPFVVILNSDTLVCPGWLDRLHAAFRARPHTGMSGPLSNAASWQSIPETVRHDATWSTNDMIDPEDRFRVQALLDQVTERAYPDFPILNGFCTLIAREVFDVIGLFDEDAFPMGYGEETDLCLRARRAGFGLTVADDCFVYHHKSVTFGSANRLKLTRAGSFEMRNKHIGVSVPALEQAMQACPPMQRLRLRMTELLAEHS